MSEGQEFGLKPRIIQFKGEQGRMQRVDLNNLEAVFANIQAHNEEFSFGRLLAKGAISKHPLSSEKDRRDALSETLGIIYADSFSPIGISFDTSSETGAAITTQGEQIAETKIKFGLQNPDIFLSFLDALNTMDKKELSGSAIPSLLIEIGDDIFGQVKSHYRSYLIDARVPVIAQRLNEIVLIYKKLGIEIPEDLENYAKYAKQGILAEYIVADLNGLLSEPKETEHEFQYRSLANWRNDISLQSLQGRWEEAMSILGDMRKNPKTKELFEEIKTNLSHCIKLALEDMDSKDESWDLKGNNWVKMRDKREVFENARINLQII